MIYVIPKESVPNQTFGININGYNVFITLKTAKNLTLFSLDYGNSNICSSIRCCPNSRIFFNTDLNLGGFFFWRCPEGDYPYYENFENQDLLFIEDEAE